MEEQTIQDRITSLQTEIQNLKAKLNEERTKTYGSLIGRYFKKTVKEKTNFRVVLAVEPCSFSEVLIGIKSRTVSIGTSADGGKFITLKDQSFNLPVDAPINLWPDHQETTEEEYAAYLQDTYAQIYSLSTGIVSEEGLEEPFNES